jgi:hypothetical protein
MNQQINKEHFMPLAYFKSQAFTGSLSGMRYLVQKASKTVTTVDGEEQSSNILEAFVWPEPFSFEHTPDEQKIRMEFEFSEEGISAAVDWINEQRMTWIS